MDKYYIHDARDLASVVKKKVDLIVTSPPYFDMKDYGPQNQIGYGQQYSEYLEDMNTVLKQCSDVAKDSASLWMVVDTLKKDKLFKLLPFDLVAEAQKVGWTLQDIIIWKKDKTLPFSRRGEFRSIFEYVLFFVKSDSYKYYPERITEHELKEWWVKYPERYSPLGKAKSDVWEFPIPVQGSWGNQYVRHFCPLPSKMIDQIIELCTDEGDIVLDPFAGSGAVLTEAHRLKRKYVGCDLNDDFRKMFQSYLTKVDKQEEGTGSRDIKVVFGTTVTKLRILKWPSALVKKLRQVDKSKIDAIQGIIVSEGESSSTYKYTFLLNRNDKKLQETILKLSKQPPFTKYGFKYDIFFEYNQPKDLPEWEYNWVSTHLKPKKFEGSLTPYIASNIVLDDSERELVNHFLATGKLELR